MKKAISIILTGIITAMLLSACSIGECDLCGKKGIVHERTILGTTIYVCSDCG